MTITKWILCAGTVLAAGQARADVVYNFSSATAEFIFVSPDFLDFTARNPLQIPSSSFSRNRFYEGILVYDSLGFGVGRDDGDRITLLSYAGAAPIIDSWVFPDGAFAATGSYTVVGTAFNGFVIGPGTLTVAAVSAVPEPGMGTWLCAGLGMLGWASRRARAKTRSGPRAGVATA